MKVLLTITVMISLPALAIAQDDNRYQCTMGDLTRRIEVMHETGVTVPCEVHYYKDTESPGERQVLWRAMNEEGYCEAKTSEFVTQLTDMGWNCGIAAESVTMEDEAKPEVEPDEDMTDDTEALAPAEEVDSPPEEES